MMEVLSTSLLAIALYVLGVLTPFFIYKKMRPNIGFSKIIYWGYDEYIHFYVINLSKHEVRNIEANVTVTSQNGHYRAYFELEPVKNYIGQFAFMSTINDTIEPGCRLRIKINFNKFFTPFVANTKDTVLFVEVSATHSFSGIRRSFCKLYSMKENLGTSKSVDLKNYDFKLSRYEVVKYTLFNTHKCVMYK